MRKVIFLFVMIGIIGSANALPNITTGTPRPTSNEYAYYNGYKAGKSHAYNNVAKGAFVVGFLILAGFVIYNIGNQECENGLACVKF